MQRIASSGLKRGRGWVSSFSLVELLTVIVIIVIMVAMTLWAAGALLTRAARTRTVGEIQGISSNLENYKIDNGIYPAATNLVVNSTNASASYTLDPSTSGGNYQKDSQLLYEALAGKTNYNDVAINKSYMVFKTSQLGNYTNAANTVYSATKSTYLADPWTYAYGYSTGDGSATNIPYSGSGFFDLWSTGGLTTNSAATVYATNTWITSWRQ